MPSESIDAAYEVLAGKQQILVFTGAGMSTESGIPDFRGPDGLWTKMDPADFTIQRYYASKELRIQKWRMQADGLLWGARSPAQPNPGHMAIVDLYEAGMVSGVVTQNVDGLHERSGLPDDAVAELHGSVRTSSCMECGRQWPTDTVLEWVDAGQEDPHCPVCGGLVKTDVVMFGEAMPDAEMQKAWRRRRDTRSAGDPTGIERADALGEVRADRLGDLLECGVLEMLALDVEVRVEQLRPGAVAIVGLAVVADAPQPPATDLRVAIIGLRQDRDGAIAQGLAQEPRLGGLARAIDSLESYEETGHESERSVGCGR